MSRTLVELPVLTADQLESGLARAIEEAGCCVVSDAVDPATMDAIAAELAAFRSQASIGASDFEGHRVRPRSSRSPCTQR
jgi:ectoine hydroxylase-related dioxygenase (phytanoyl-CoA dioxygenase family)